MKISEKQLAQMIHLLGVACSLDGAFLNKPGAKLGRDLLASIANQQSEELKEVE